MKKKLVSIVPKKKEIEEITLIDRRLYDKMLKSYGDDNMQEVEKMLGKGTELKKSPINKPSNK